MSRRAVERWKSFEEDRTMEEALTGASLDCIATASGQVGQGEAHFPRACTQEHARSSSVFGFKADAPARWVSRSGRRQAAFYSVAQFLREAGSDAGSLLEGGQRRLVVGFVDDLRDDLGVGNSVRWVNHEHRPGQ